MMARFQPIYPLSFTIFVFLLVRLGQAAPYFTNVVYNLEPGKPFEITWAGANGPINITLRNGPVDDLRPVAVIDTNDSRNSFTWVPPSSLTMSLPSGIYDFEIEDTDGTNYSVAWSFVGSVTTETVTIATESQLPKETAKVVDSLPTSTATENTGLSPGAKAGIGVGAGIGGIFLLAGAAFIVSRLRSPNYVADHDNRWWLGIGKAELDAGDKIRPELGGTAVSEMEGIPWKQQPVELAAAGEHDDEIKKPQGVEDVTSRASSDESESGEKELET